MVNGTANCTNGNTTLITLFIAFGEIEITEGNRLFPLLRLCVEPNHKIRVELCLSPVE